MHRDTIVAYTINNRHLHIYSKNFQHLNTSDRHSKAKNTLIYFKWPVIFKMSAARDEIATSAWELKRNTALVNHKLHSLHWTLLNTRAMLTRCVFIVYSRREYDTDLAVWTRFLMVLARVSPCCFMDSTCTLSVLSCKEQNSRKSNQN